MAGSDGIWRSQVAYAVVTGGSEGIGLALAKRIARSGMAVLLVARNGTRLAEAAAEVRATAGRRGGAVDILACDITHAGATAAIDAHVAARGGYVDLLVNNAGTGQAGEFATAEPGRLEKLIALNVAAPTALMRWVLPGMQARRRGGIITIASLGGFVPGPNQAAYYASKAYVLSLGEAVAHEARRFGVRVLTVAPGPVETEFHARMGADAALYRRLIPSLRPDTVARWTMLAYRLGLRVVVPGFFNTLMAAALRILPHRVVIPLVGWLLRP